MTQSFHFANLHLLWLLLLLLPLSAFYYFYGKREKPSLRLSSTAAFEARPSLKVKMRPLLYVLRLLALALLIVALARPQIEKISSKRLTTKGIDIVMAIDVSGSMLSRDLRPNRLEALKAVAKDFVAKRPNDRIGIVLYSGESYTKIPVTTDKAIIDKAIDEIAFGQIEDGTAIGLGLGTAVNRLKDSKAKSKVIILLTDGVNNSGFIDPKTAAELAYQYNIKTYTIGIGSNGMAMSPVAYNPITKALEYDMRKVEIDEGLLKYIAERTGGEYFRATDNEKLQSIYDLINKLEKTDIEDLKYYNYDEYYRYFTLLAGVFIFFEVMLRCTVFRSFI